MQPYVDWEVVESKTCDYFKYQIIRAEKPNGDIVYKGFVVYRDGSDNWVEHESRDVLRMSLTNLGTQHS